MVSGNVSATALRRGLILLLVRVKPTVIVVASGNFTGVRILYLVAHCNLLKSRYRCIIAYDLNIHIVFTGNCISACTIPPTRKNHSSRPHPLPTFSPFPNDTFPSLKWGTHWLSCWPGLWITLEVQTWSSLYFFYGRTRVLYKSWAYLVSPREGKCAAFDSSYSLFGSSFTICPTPE